MALVADTNAQMLTLAADGKGTANSDPLVQGLPGQAPHSMEQHPAWPMIARLPVMLAVTIPLRGLKVCSLLDLRCGQIVGGSWAVTADVPLKVGALQVCWGEFEVVEQRMALRLTRLA